MKKTKFVKNQNRTKKDLELSIKEGASSSVMTGFGESYITPFALALNANNSQIGFLTSFAGLVGPFSQILGSRLMEKYRRKKIIITFVALQALTWLPILLLSLFFWKNIFTTYLPIILIIFYSLFAIFGSISGPSWFSLMGDLVPDKIRGRYFSKRNKITGAVALLSTLIGAFILDYFKTKGSILIGFSILFFIASLARLNSARLFKKHSEPQLKLKKSYYFSIFSFIKNMPYNNFGRFVMFIGFFYFAAMIAGPFFAVYMLKDLGFSYTTFILISISASIFSLLSLPIWGKLSDKYGNREILRLTLIFIPIAPILWLFSKNPLYLIFIPQLIAGLGWAGFNLSSSNFIYDSVSPQRRGLCVAYFSILRGIGIFIGAALGGLLAQYLTIRFMNKLLFIFLISGILRALVAIIFLPKIKEIRKLAKPKKLYQYIEDFKPHLHLRNLHPTREIIDLIPNHTKIIKFKKSSD